jgi:aminopeptidase YwaD
VLDGLADRVAVHLETIVRDAGHRPPGSPANRRATDRSIATLRTAGLSVTTLPFRTRWWTPGEAHLRVGDTTIPLEPPPFGAPARAAGPVRVLATDDALAAAPAGPGELLVLTGSLAEPLFPKAFPFVVIPEHQARIAALEARRPAAVLAVVEDDATEPVFEDPDLAFPYAMVPRSRASSLLEGVPAELVVEARLEDGEGVNVSAGPIAGPRAIVCAHIDSKVTTPGALDNGGGVAVLLALAESGLDGLGPVELVLFNGEDHYSAPGEQAWLAARGVDGVELVVNIDGAGLRGHPTAVSTLGADAPLEAAVAAALASVPSCSAGEPWFESDHAMFAMQGIPSIAITSGAPFDELKRRSHAPDDGIHVVDPVLLADVVRMIRAVLAAPVRGSLAG